MAESASETHKVYLHELTLYFIGAISDITEMRVSCCDVKCDMYSTIRRLCVALQSDLTQDISTSVLWVDSKPHMITLDYTIHVPQDIAKNLPEVRYYTPAKHLKPSTTAVNKAITLANMILTVVSLLPCSILAYDRIVGFNEIPRCQGH